MLGDYSCADCTVLPTVSAGNDLTSTQFTRLINKMSKPTYLSSASSSSHVRNRFNADDCRPEKMRHEETGRTTRVRMGLG